MMINKISRSFGALGRFPNTFWKVIFAAVFMHFLREYESVRSMSLMRITSSKENRWRMKSKADKSLQKKKNRIEEFYTYTRAIIANYYIPSFTVHRCCYFDLNFPLYNSTSLILFNLKLNNKSFKTKKTFFVKWLILVSSTVIGWNTSVKRAANGMWLWFGFSWANV